MLYPISYQRRTVLSPRSILAKRGEENLYLAGFLFPL